MSNTTVPLPARLGWVVLTATLPLCAAAEMPGG
jgi:hypothetical protein